MLFPFALRDFFAQRELEGNHTFQILGYLTFEFNVVPMAFASEGGTIGLECKAGKLCVGHGVSNNEIRLEVGLPYVDLFHSLDVAELDNTIISAELFQRNQSFFASRVSQHFG